MSFSLVFTPYNIPPFAPKQARRSKLENVTPVKNEPNANVCSPSRISVAISRQSRLTLPVDGGDALPKRASVSHTLSLATIPGFASRLLGATDGGNAFVAVATAEAAFRRRNPCTMQMSVITFNPSSTSPGLITP